MLEQAKIWKRLDGTPLEASIYETVEQTILRESSVGHKLKVCIGSDSLAKADGIEYATAIVFLREKKGGFMFVNREKCLNNISIKERMITEVAKSIEIAYHICPILEKYNVELEVHADINTDPEFKSNVALKEAMGYILGMGYSFKAKPDAFASSCCADRVIS